MNTRRNPIHGTKIGVTIKVVESQISEEILYTQK